MVLTRQMLSILYICRLYVIHNMYASYNTACALGGLAIPAGMLRATLVKKKVYWSRSRHRFASSRVSKSSPIGNPQPPKNVSWIEGECWKG
jgi:hypothetical protein